MADRTTIATEAPGSGSTRNRNPWFESRGACTWDSLGSDLLRFLVCQVAGFREIVWHIGLQEIRVVLFLTSFPRRKRHAEPLVNVIEVAQPEPSRAGSVRVAPHVNQEMRQIHHSTSSAASRRRRVSSERNRMISLALVDDRLTPLRVFGVDAVQAHAQAVFDHRHGIVAQAAKRTQVVLGLISAGVAIGDMLDGRRRRFAEDAEVVVAVETLFPPLPVFGVGVVRARTNGRGSLALRGLFRDLDLAFLTDPQCAPDNETGPVCGRLERQRHVVPD